MHTTTLVCYLMQKGTCLQNFMEYPKLYRLSWDPNLSSMNQIDIIAKFSGLRVICSIPWSAIFYVIIISYVSLEFCF